MGLKIPFGINSKNIVCYTWLNLTEIPWK